MAELARGSNLSVLFSDTRKKPRRVPSVRMAFRPGYYTGVLYANGWSDVYFEDRATLVRGHVNTYYHTVREDIGKQLDRHGAGLCGAYYAELYVPQGRSNRWPDPVRFRVLYPLRFGKPRET